METLTVDEAGSTLAEQGLLILSVTSIDDRRPRTVELVVGRVGFPSLSRTLKAGGAVLFETPDYGVFEIRLLRIYIGYQTPGSLPNTATFSISPLTRRPGPMAGLENENSDNHPFTASEVARIRESIEGVKDSVGQRDDVTPEQVDYISRKLDEIVDATGRLGRRDWINVAIGTMTNLVVGAAVNSDAAKFLFYSLGQSLEWLLGETLKLLS